MFHVLSHSRLVWLGIGLVGGLLICGTWPQTPLHAVATDRAQTFAMATGPVDDEFEAVYFLDFLTGELNAVVLGRQGNAFTAFYTYKNLVNDLGVDPSKNPKYMMVTGMANLRRGTGRLRPSLSAVYVAEVTTGKVAAYAIPWSKNAHASGQIIGPAPLMPLAATRFRAAADAGIATPPVP
ncbi:MAG: hypothetical protein ACYSWU_20165 [Planctomycetota bacterium]|jgi:hypothetical protein